MVQKLISAIFYLVKNHLRISQFIIFHIVPKPLLIRFDEIDGFIISLDGKIKHLALFDYGLLHKICNKTKYLISKKNDITNSINYNFGITLERSKLIHIILCLLKNVNFS